MRLSLNKILLIAIISIASVILITTAVAFATGKASIGTQYRVADPTTAEKIKSDSGALDAFKEFSQIRIITKPDPDGTTLIIKPWLSYQKNDREFYEELAQKKRLLVSIISEYFSSHTKKELFKLGEKKVKQELLSKINDNLTISKVKGIYFDDYVFIE